MSLFPPMEVDGEPERKGRVLWTAPDKKSVLMVEELGWFEPGLWDEWIVEETYRKFLFAVTDVELPY